MPITRIKSIKQIGRFKNFTGGGSVPLANLNDGKNIAVIYGDNTYGKSTLADILRSTNLSSDVEIIRRKTIPKDDGSNQSFELSYQHSAASRQESVKYDRTAWSNNVLVGKILIFDQEFIHQNIFTGIHLTRDNKENFTDFILGEEGVKIGAEIERRNIASKKFPDELRLVRPEYVRAEADNKKVESFIGLNVTDSRKALEGEIDTQNKLIKRLSRVSEFTNLQPPKSQPERYSTTFNGLKELIAKVKASSYDDVSRDALDQIHERLQQTDSHWLEQGTKHLLGDKCPYCTQDILPVKSLIDAYKTVFDKKYDEYVSSTNKDILTIKSTLSTLSATQHSKRLSLEIEKVKKYAPFIGEIKDLIVTLDTQLESLQASESNMRNYIAESLEQSVDTFVTYKKENIHKQCDYPVAIDGLSNIIGIADNNNDQLQKTISACASVIETKREEVSRWTPDVVTENRKKATDAISLCEAKINRLDQDVQCRTYVAKQLEQKEFKEYTAKLQEKLESEQSHYLETLFTSINGWFSKLGSQDFKLDKNQSRRGNKTVYELRVLFCDELVDNDDLSKVFSESDRRNLALAVYLSRAELLTKEDTILVLDDPVVSFDDNRIRATCAELSRLAKDFEQIIILTHYKTVIRRLLKSRVGAVYLKVEKDGTGSRLGVLNTKDLHLSDHERAYLRLASFVNGTSNDPGGLRQFMEKHIDLVFQPKLRELGLSDAMLSEKISSLETAGEIDSSTKSKLDGFRDTLNPDHHNDEEDATIEDMRLLTRSVLEEVYKL
ncbi:MAG: AAA family ATPase [Candidatus Nomurabacteria bacterium]|nr:MAG: AAA family ATPase [Candidatus Nomurabacteria bacterium]